MCICFVIEIAQAQFKRISFFLLWKFLKNRVHSIFQYSCFGSSTTILGDFLLKISKEKYSHAISKFRRWLRGKIAFSMRNYVRFIHQAAANICQVTYTINIPFINYSHTHGQLLLVRKANKKMTMQCRKPFRFRRWFYCSHHHFT